MQASLLFFFITPRKSAPSPFSLSNLYLMKCHLVRLVFDVHIYISMQVWQPSKTCPLAHPRTREGATEPAGEQWSASVVSIHAPVKVRPLLRAEIHGEREFQFTHLWRCDHIVDISRDPEISFNSRTCEGATTTKKMIDYNPIVSIHAPVKVRLLKQSTLYDNPKFQFTHLWRCDKKRVQRRNVARGFNSRTCEGATTGI